MTILVPSAVAPSAREGKKPDSAPHVHPPRGEYGSSLDFLRRHYARPRGPGESNHFIDLWADQDLEKFAITCNLTNNHALFVNSHGKSLVGPRGTEYAFYPHTSLLPLGEKAPAYSAADLAMILGPASVASIHSIVVSGCNAEGAFSAREIRRHFLQATNIVHMAAGALGYQSMFRQLLTSPSWNIQPAYERCAKADSGKLEYVVGSTPSPKATRLTPYIAELFKPGAITPFRCQTAGRELFAPTEPSLIIQDPGQ